MEVVCMAMVFWVYHCIYATGTIPIYMSFYAFIYRCISF